MPPFWLIGYVELVWNRTIQGFVPASVLRGKIPEEMIDQLRFMNESEVDAQMKELEALGCTRLEKKAYGNAKRIGD